MRKASVLFFVLVCMAYIAACGGKSSTSTATNYDPLTTPTKPSPVSSTLLGGSIQGTTSLPLTSPPPLIVSTVAGSVAGFNNLSSAGVATFKYPISVTTDGTNLYVVDYFNNAIRKINIVSKHVTTVAGNAAGLAGSADGAASVALFNHPRAITTDGTNLYVADSGNFTIRKIEIATGNVTTLAGAVGQAGSIDNAIGTSARFNVVNGITTDGISLYVTDSNNTIRRIVLPPSGTIPSGPVTTLAGTPGTLGSVDGIQSVARFNQLAGITTDGPNLYVSDFGNSTIRKIVLSSGAVSTIAGAIGPGGSAGAYADSTGTGQTARFNQPNGITCDGVNLYVTDQFDDVLNNKKDFFNTVRKIVLTGDGYSGPVSTLVTLGSSTANSNAGSSVVGITTNGGSLFVTDATTDITSAASVHVVKELK
jgi:hypothetical protein